MDKNEMNQAEELNAQRDSESMDRKDLIAGIVLIVFSLYVLGSGIYMSMTTMKLADSPWYGTPGMLPIFIGSALFIFSSIMCVSLLRAGVRVGNETIEAIKSYLTSVKFRRFLVAIGFLAIYIFVLFGRVHYCIATFLYLFSTILYFRENGFAVWKIAVIAAVFTAFMYFFFGVLAGVPLP